jgi:hypothetical protein
VRRVPLRPLLFALLTGCYTNVPLVGSRPEPVPGTRLVLELTDQGRVGMEGQLGPEVARVEGALVSRSDTSYVLGVSAVIGLWGALSKWQGERVTLRADYIRRMSERRFSMGRTVAAVGVSAAGFLVFVVTRSLLGGGNEGGPGPDGPPPNGT